MPIVGLPKRLHEAGRIRIGEQVAMKGGRKRPTKLGTYRFTSADQAKIEHIARLYGGQPEPWQNGPNPQWQVTTDTDVLECIVPPADMAFTQWYELWSGGGCKRRCDGQRETLSDQPCVCDPDPDKRECKATTRLSLMLAQVQGAGLWRIESHGYYAAIELAASVDLIQLVAERGGLLPATLRLDKRSVSRPGQKRKDFVVPVLDVKLPLEAIAQATAGALGTGAPAAAGSAGMLMAGGDRSASEEQRVAIRAACRHAGLDDDGRHDLLWLVTNERVSSSRDPDLLMDDVDQVLVACELLAGKHAYVGETGEGDLRLLRAGGEIVGFPLDAGKVRAWIKAQADAADATPAVEEHAAEPEQPTLDGDQ